MTKGTKYTLIVGITLLITLCAAAACFVHREFFKCGYWYLRCVTLDRDDQEYKLEVVKKLDAAKAVWFLCHMLDDNNVFVCREAAYALGKLGDRRAVVPLIQAIKGKTLNLKGPISFWGKPFWPEIAIEALGKIGEPALEPLIQALKDEDSQTRRWVVRVLGEIGDKRAVEPLIAALKDEDERVCCSAAEALGNFADIKAVACLRKLTTAEDMVLQGVAYA
ncbi:unnamed protein product, partial [marine sediment metagenome]